MQPKCVGKKENARETNGRIGDVNKARRLANGGGVSVDDS